MTQEEATKWALNKIESATKPKTPEYLGNGVYAYLDGGAIKLTTENAVEITNRIYLEPEVFQALERFAERIGWRPE